MGYEIQMQAKILALLSLFDQYSPDEETHVRVKALVADESKWLQAHHLFDIVRKRLLSSKGKREACYQYAFEELCLKTVFNETDTEMPFDTNSSFWLAGAAIQYARRVGVPLESVIAVLAPESD